LGAPRATPSTSLGAVLAKFGTGVGGDPPAAHTAPRAQRRSRTRAGGASGGARSAMEGAWLRDTGPSTWQSVLVAPDARCIACCASLPTKGMHEHECSVSACADQACVTEMLPDM
jgi:hypothetical protein